MLTKIYNEYSRYFGTDSWIISDGYIIGDTAYNVVVGAKPTKIESNRVTWRFYSNVIVYSACNEISSRYQLNKMTIFLTTTMTSTWKDYDYRTIRFRTAEKPKMSIHAYWCCGSDDWSFDDGAGFEEMNPNNDDKEEEKKEEKEKDKLKREKKCCDNTPGDNSVGFFPTIGFGNNLDDSTIGIGVEYLRKAGSSLENNNWYYGIGGQFTTSSGQGGELKEHFYSASAILENRTPILPCVQWTQRVSGEYGQGTLEAFGNKDDFTHFLVGLSTGVNFDLSANFSVAIDARLFEVGSQTFKPTNGPEIKTDIKNLSLPPTEVRFGLRLNF